MSILKKLFAGASSGPNEQPERKLGCGALLLSTYIDREALHDQPELLRQMPADDEKRVLLFQRGYAAPDYPGSLGGPGGIFEATKDATPAETAARETKEEANIMFTPEEPPLTKGTLPDRDVIYFIGRWYPAEDGIIHTDHQAVGHVWLTGNQALQMNLSFGYRSAIEKLIKQGRL